MNTTHLLEFDRVTKIFSAGGGFFARGHVRAVDDISFSLSGSEPTLITLVGESGSGKTTISRLILGLTHPTSGEIRYKGKNTQEMTKEEWMACRKQVQAVFQDPYGIYNPFYKIDRVLETPIKKFALASSGAEARDLIAEALDAVELRPDDTLGRYPHQLSGGERQRIMLARLYLMRPELIVADEPVSMIDVSLRASFLNILLDFEQEYGMSCLFITHNLATGYYLGGQIIILCQGRIVEKGDMDVVVHNPVHPYSQLLIASVPPPDPADRWQTNIETQIGERRQSPEMIRGCIYAERCPRALAACSESPPPMVSVGENHEVACHLYE